MIYYLETKLSNLRYSDQGEGELLIIVHDYLETIETFDAFANDLARVGRVICIDLLGPGKSDLKRNNFSVEEMADAVCDSVLELNLSNGWGILWEITLL